MSNKELPAPPPTNKKIEKISMSQLHLTHTPPVPPTQSIAGGGPSGEISKSLLARYNLPEEPAKLIESLIGLLDNSDAKKDALAMLDTLSTACCKMEAVVPALQKILNEEPEANVAGKAAKILINILGKKPTSPCHPLPALMRKDLQPLLDRIVQGKLYAHDIPDFKDFKKSTNQSISKICSLISGEERFPSVFHVAKCISDFNHEDATVRENGIQRIKLQAEKGIFFPELEPKLFEMANTSVKDPENPSKPNPSSYVIDTPAPPSPKKPAPSSIEEQAQKVLYMYGLRNVPASPPPRVPSTAGIPLPFQLLLRSLKGKSLWDKTHKPQKSSSLHLSSNPQEYPSGPPL